MIDYGHMFHKSSLPTMHIIWCNILEIRDYQIISYLSVWPAAHMRVACPIQRCVRNWLGMCWVCVRQQV